MQEEFTDLTKAQTQPEIERYYRNAKLGNPAAIRETQGNILQFIMTTIDGISADGRRVYLKTPASWGGVAFQIKSGKNRQSPTGQSRLIISTPEVRAFAEEHPHGRWRCSKG
jgi:hypothetical protein